MSVEIDPRVCPSCGEPNACGLSQGQSECWCFSVKIEKGTLERIPSEKKNLACICARCAAAATSKACSERA
jgi:Cysteine-rich CWC